MLLIFDNCKGMISECKEYFNKTLRDLANSISDIKIIVLTDQKDDLDDVKT